MKEEGIDAFYVGSGDAHQSEYVASSEERRAFISGFTGSAGTALVTSEHALLWTDGRYYLQASNQLSSDWTLMKAGQPGVPEVDDWLCETLPAGSVVGIDAWLLSASSANTMHRKLSTRQIAIKSVDVNPVDRVWAASGGRAACPREPVRLHPTEKSGRSRVEKISELRAAIEKNGAGACILSMLDEVAWLLNLRGNDVEFNPVFMSYVLVTASSVQLFTDLSRVPAEVRSDLEKDGIELLSYEAVESVLTSTASARKVLADDTQLNMRLYTAIGSNAVTKASPVTLAKSIKNSVEMDGFRQCHIRDGAALTAFLCWLEGAVLACEPVTEFTAAEKLETFRGRLSGHVSPSFATIAGFAANGAIIHYKPERETASSLSVDGMFLLDSGGQYCDGTTDVTRTVHWGEPSDHMKMCYTRVLQGHIALATAIFPEGTLGSRLDALARYPLWSCGLDYNHGTGHGVGSHLNVHEGPQGIGFRKRDREEGFKAGMTISNEPGYYEDGAFGIRIETVCLCVEKDTPHRFGNQKFLGFETVTMTPISTKLVVPELLTAKEREWLNAYNAEVRSKLAPLITAQFPEASSYLERECRAL